MLVSMSRCGHEGTFGARELSSPLAGVFCFVCLTPAGLAFFIQYRSICTYFCRSKVNACLLLLKIKKVNEMSFHLKLIAVLSRASS